jgi:hypothetical protein
MAVTLEHIAEAIADYDSEVTVEIIATPYGYIQVNHPDFIYTINFGEADNGWSYNDNEGYGFGDFIGSDHFTSAKEIADVFFGQVTTNENLSKSKKGLQDTWSTFQKELQNTNNASCDCADC